VAIWRRCGGNDEVRATSISHQLVHLGEVRWHESDGAVAEMRTRDVGKKVRDVGESVSVCARQVGAVVECVHLLDSDAIDPRVIGRGCFFDCVEHGGWFTVGERNDQLCSWTDVVQDVTGDVRSRY
jgi:hypothetical protein